MQKEGSGGLYSAIMWMLSKHLGRPAKVIDLVDILEISKPTAYNKAKKSLFTAADLEKVSQKTGIPLYLVGVDSKTGRAEIEAFPLFDTANTETKAPVYLKIVM